MSSTSSSQSRSEDDASALVLLVQQQEPAEFPQLPSKAFARVRIEDAPDVTACGAVALQGRRSSMEDGFCICSVLDVSGAGMFHMFAVFDGHGGHEAASYCKRHIYSHVQTALNEHLVALGPDAQRTRSDAWAAAVTEALRHGIISLNAAFEATGQPALDAGCTAVVALLAHGRAWVANVGDSRAVLGTLTGPPVDSKCSAFPLSEDHSPSRADERKRIEDAGGFIQYHPHGKVCYVGGMLAMTRAIGDVNMRPFVTCAPDVIMHVIDTSKDQFIVLATDGLWDVFGNQDAVESLRSFANVARDIVTNAAVNSSTSSSSEEEKTTNKRRAMLLRPRRPEDIALYAVRRLAHSAICERGTHDNVTILMVCLQDVSAPPEEIAPETN